MIKGFSRSMGLCLLHREGHVLFVMDPIKTSFKKPDHHGRLAFWLGVIIFGGQFQDAKASTSSGDVGSMDCMDQ